jgi:hypothetical protein
MLYNNKVTKYIDFFLLDIHYSLLITLYFEMSMSIPAGPFLLSGIKVLDFSRILAAPLVSQIFGDLGAEVWKVEKPGQFFHFPTAVLSPHNRLLWRVVKIIANKENPLMFDPP